MAAPRQEYPIYSVMLVDGDSVPASAADDAAYDDATGAADGTLISLLKGIYIQLAEINAKTPEV